jgi:hypothetical protein
MMMLGKNAKDPSRDHRSLHDVMQMSNPSARESDERHSRPCDDDEDDVLREKNANAKNTKTRATTSRRTDSWSQPLESFFAAVPHFIRLAVDGE